MIEFYYLKRVILFAFVVVVTSLSCSLSSGGSSGPTSEAPLENSPTPIIPPIIMPTDTPIAPPVITATPTQTAIAPPAVAPTATATLIAPPVVVPTAMVTPIAPPAITPTPMYTLFPGGSSDGSCPGAPPQRLNVGGKAYICTLSDPVRLRDGAGRQFSALVSLDPGTGLNVIGGPICADGWSWWRVQTYSGNIGWIAEGGDSVDPYFLCPR
jgi:hypothetical protein